MHHIQLSIASGEDSLSVRKFIVKERLSQPFHIELLALSPNDDLEFDAIVGKNAAFSLNSGTVHLQKSDRAWHGIVRSIRQVQAETKGLSAYELHLVPRFWLLTQRSNCRVFQHLSIPGIVEHMLGAWNVRADFRLDKAAFPKLNLRVQYNESDFEFVSRLLEEAAISYFFETREDGTSWMILGDAPQSSEPRAGGSLIYADNPNQAAEREFITKIGVEQDVRPGRFLIRDFDFRRRPELLLVGEASGSQADFSEDMLEQYRYMPGAFLVEEGKPEGTPVADDRGMARHDEKAGKQRAERHLKAVRAQRKALSFETNAMDLAPGVTFAVKGHPRKDLGRERKLLVTEFMLEGSPLAEWTLSGKAVFCDLPYAPRHQTPKPKIFGVQSAVVVGPKGEEIHTDEFGRVRVQFHWDREGKRDDSSSCWMRVSQGWAGSGYGMIAIPRVGHEVLVGFLEGDPDLPVVVGRLFNHTSAAPYNLPEHKTVSGWRGDSTPGSDGFNEIRFDDAKGRELLYVQAERTLNKLVKVDEIEMTRNERVIEVGKKLTLTTGKASIVLEGGNILIEGTGLVQMKSSGSDVVLEGSPDVKVNPGPEETEPSRAEFEEEDDEDANVRGGEDAGAARLREDEERYGQGVLLKGSKEFRALCREGLNTIGGTAMGETMSRRMAGSGHETRIMEAKTGSGAAKAHSLKDAELRRDGKPGVGCGTAVYYNPGYEPAGGSAVAVLGKYMAHAYHNAMGQRESGLRDGVKRADLQALGLGRYGRAGFHENSLRKQLGMEARKAF